MLNSGKKIALCVTKKNILTLVLSEKKNLNETKNHNPPLQVKWSVPKFSVFHLSYIRVVCCIPCTVYNNVL